MNVDAPRRALGRAASRARRISPSSTTSTIFASIVLPIPGSSFACPSSASSRDRSAASRGSALGRAAVGDDAERLAPRGSRAGRRAGRAGRRARRSAGSVAAIAAMIRRCPMRADRLPPDLQRAREPRADGAGARRRARHRARPRARDRRRLARTGPARSPTGSPPSSPWVDVLHRAAKEGIGPAYLAGFRRALADGAELVLEMDCDFSHDPRDVPRLIAACEATPTSCSARATSPAAAPRTGAVAPASSRAAAASTRRSSSACGVRDLTGGFKCFRRARARDDRPRRDRRARATRFQIETTYRALPGRVPRRRRSRSRSSTARAGASKMSRRDRRSRRCWQVPLLRAAALLTRQAVAHGRGRRDATFDDERARVAESR